MNYSRESLLKKSIKEFEDNKANTLVYTTEQIVTDSGFVYILKKPNPKKISCAIHYTRHWDSDWDVGKIENIDYEINSREYIEPESVIEYEGIQIAYASIDSYNETMKQYHYRALSIHGYSNKFIIMDEKSIDSDLSINSFPILFNFFKQATKLPVFPSYFNVSRAASSPDYQFISIDIPSTRCINILATDAYADTYNSYYSLTQNNNDEVRVAFVNMNMTDTYLLIDKLKQFLETAGDNGIGIGLVESMKIYPKEVYQKSFNIKSSLNICEFSVNYNLIIIPDDPNIKFIKSSLIEMLRNS